VQPIVLYDADCPLCCQLASWIERKSEGKFVVEASGPEGADRLRVKTSEGLLEGVAAWEWLLAEVKELSGLAWLAARLGLTRETAAAMAQLGYAARRLCWRCPKS
jgi:hypothetical protein